MQAALSNVPNLHSRINGYLAVLQSSVFDAV
jgi:hypothetical protein